MMAHPQLVGNSFVNQYYNVLHQSPQVVHRFYTDSSSLTRAEVGPEGHSETVFGQNGIHEKVMSMDYMGLKAEIKTVDCQDSYSGSVLVMVTGSLSRSHDRRDFVQTFFLAPQSKGYFVLNDIFRYLDEPQSSYSMPNGAREHSPAPESVPEAPHREVSDSVPAAVAEEQIEDEYEMPQQEPEEEELVSEDPVHSNAPLETDEAVDADDAQRDLPKKSYASILRVAQLQHLSTSSPAAAAVVVADKPGASSAQANSLPSPALPPPIEAAAIEEATAPSDVQVECKAIYIKNLPMTITVPLLDEEFQRFGAVKPGSTNVKKLQNVCYAFMEFEDVTSARAAVQASPIQIGMKAVYVEEKRQPGGRGGGGGGYRGRGRGRSEGGGRGGGRGFYGGRGNGGGGRNYEPSNRGRGGSRGGYVNVTNNNNSSSSNTNSSSNQGTASFSNSNEESSSYHPRFDTNNNNSSSSSISSAPPHNSVTNSSNNTNGSNYGNGSRPPRRGYIRSNSYGRNAAHHPAAAPATMTAA